MIIEGIRASNTTAVRYERDRPGELVHMDVMKIGRIPDGAAGAPMADNHWSYTAPTSLRHRGPRHHATHDQAALPWQNGKASNASTARMGRRHVFTSSDEGGNLPATCLDNDNERRRHSALGSTTADRPPIRHPEAEHA
jgi:hypothetical protein